MHSIDPFALPREIIFLAASSHVTVRQKKIHCAREAAFTNQPIRILRFFSILICICGDLDFRLLFSAAYFITYLCCR